MATCFTIFLAFVGGYFLTNKVFTTAQAGEEKEPPTHRIHSLDEMIKDPILANAMHTNDNYKFLYGKVRQKGDKGESFAEVWINQNGDGKYKVIWYRDVNDSENVYESTNRGDKVKTTLKKHGKVEITDSLKKMKLPTPEKRLQNAVYPNWNGTFTGTIVDSLIHPESDIQSLFLRSKVSNDGVVEILGRKVTKFIVDPQYKKDKVDTGHYEYYFDNETGILLKIISYDGNEVKEETCFEELEFKVINDNKFDFKL